MDIAANTIRQAFSEDGLFDLNKLQQELGDGISLIKGPRPNKPIKIESIFLEGFSRGAVSALATAKQLNDLNIRMDILANQPVSSQLNEAIKDSLYYKYHDLSESENIQSATILLASFELNQGGIKQMVPTFPRRTKVDCQQIPYQEHLIWFDDDHPIIRQHIKKKLEENYYLPHYRLYSFGQSDDANDIIKEQYETKLGQSLFYIPSEYSQPILGNAEKIKKDDMYWVVIKNKAAELIDKYLPGFNKYATDSQLSAIVAIHNSHVPDEQKSELFSFLLSDSSDAELFTDIVNETYELCEYLYYVDNKFNSNTLLARINPLNLTSYSFFSDKNLTKKLFLDYQASIFMASHDYLSNLNEASYNLMVQKITQSDKKLAHKECIKLSEKITNNLKSYLTIPNLLIDNKEITNEKDGFKPK